MSLLDSAQLASDGEFRARIQVAAITAAKDVIGEEATDDAVSLRRQSLAFAVLSSPDYLTNRFAWAVASNPAMGPDATDSDIQYTVNSVWSDLSGVFSVPGQPIDFT